MITPTSTPAPAPGGSGDDIISERDWTVSPGWGADAINKAMEYDLMPDALNRHGMDFTGPVNRMEFAGVAVRAYERLSGAQVAPTRSSPFTDTADADVQKAYAANIIIGYSDTLFEPYIQLNREQCATALTRIFKRYYFTGWTYASDASFPLSYARPARHLPVGTA